MLLIACMENLQKKKVAYDYAVSDESGQRWSSSKRIRQKDALLLKPRRTKRG